MVYLVLRRRREEGVRGRGEREERGEHTAHST